MVINKEKRERIIILMACSHRLDILNGGGSILRSLPDDILDDQSRQCETENSCNVRQRAIGSIRRGQSVFEKFIREDAFELPFGESALSLEPVAEGAGKRVTMHLPEFSHLYPGGVKFQCRPH